MRYAFIFVAILVCISLFFIKFDNSGSKKNGKVEVIRETTKKEEISKNTIASNISNDFKKNEIEQKGKKQPPELPLKKESESIINNEDQKDKNDKNISDIELEKYVFQKYDRMANAQALIKHLNNKGIKFPIAMERGKFGYEIFFEFQGSEDKETKLDELEKITGMQYNNGG